MEWQPIETAPKDGTKYLAFDDSAGFMAVCLLPYPDDPFPVVAWDYSDAGGFSHWMPLPEPPK